MKIRMKGQLTPEEQTARETMRKKAQRAFPITDETRCRKCSWTRLETGSMTRNHIDGNVFNMSPENIEFLCVPCHAEVDTEAGIWGHDGAYRMPT
jgi:5-methylcytosine-specific restriction endonuclease McrA